MPLAVALAADFESATATFAVFLRMNATAEIGMDVCRFDPFTAAFSRTIYAVFGGVFLIFLIPFHFELGIK